MIIRVKLILFMLLLFVVVSIYLLISTSLGLKLILKAVPGTASAQKISGSLLHGFDVMQFSYHNNQLVLHVNEFHLSWKAMDLLKQDLVIDEVKGRGIKVKVLSSSSSSESQFQLPSINLPINIYLPNVLFEKIDINDNAYPIKEIQASIKIENNILHMNKVKIEAPSFLTELYGKIDLRTWMHTEIHDDLTIFSYSDAPISTFLRGDLHRLSLNISSKKWLNLNLELQNYLQKLEKMTIKATWFVNATKSTFKELRHLNGHLFFSGNATGYLLQPEISGKLLARNVQFHDDAIKSLTSNFYISSDKSQKINLSLSGSKINLSDTKIDEINFKLNGILKEHKIVLNLKMPDNYSVSFDGKGGLVDSKKYLLQHSRFKISPLNLTLFPVSISLQVNNDKLLTYNSQLAHGTESLLVSGSTQLYTDNFKTKIFVVSKKFTLIDTKAYQIVVAPDLQLNYVDKNINLAGVLNILSARVMPDDFSNTTTLSSDVVFVDDNGKPINKKSESSPVFLNLLVKVQRFFVDYKGIRAVVLGELNLKKTPNTELNAQGQLKFLKGSYKAYGQALTIQEGGSVSFVQQINNPRLNIIASKKIEVSPEYIALPSYQPYLIAGVQVTGTVEEPSVHLFSVPAGVSQQDILSYLVFGFPQNQLNNSQAAILWNMLSMMSSGKSNFNLTGLQRSIQKEFGLSEFGFGSTSEYNAETQQYETGTAFVVGKRITDKLTATYNVGLLVPVNVLYLRYQLSQHWALQSDSSQLGNGGDIFYIIQRD